MKSKSRRNFIKTGIAGLSGLAVLPAAATVEKKKKAKKRKIISRKLGKTGIELPVVSMGVMNADNPNLVRAALDAGIRMLDTAHVYQRGRNESMIGTIVRERQRDRFFITTKVVGGHEKRKQGSRQKVFTGHTDLAAFQDKFLTSLKRLHTDYVDILLLHNVQSKKAAEFEPLIRQMEKWKKEGKTRLIGVSTHSNEPEVIRAVADSPVLDVVLTAFNFRQPHREEVKKAIDYASARGKGVIAMKTQAGVYWDRERVHPINMAAALKWVLGHENVHTSIPGFTTYDQMGTDLAVMENLALTAEEKMELEKKGSPGLAGLFCGQCGKCVSQCAYSMNIPDMMRSFMYAYGYRNLTLASECLAASGPLHCRDCTSCLVSCTQGFDVRRRLLDIDRLRSIPADFLA